MARLFQIISAVSRVGFLSVKPTACTNVCRLTGRSGGAPWFGKRASNKAPVYDEWMSGEDPDMEDVEEKLQALAEVERKRRKTVKFHMLRRRMTPSGAPERKLTWSAIEQIRYLKKEQPEEWTVERLAEGFSVTPDAILRVLRSKFVPPPERKAKQDAKIFAELARPALPASGDRTAGDQPKLTGSHTPAALLPGRKDSSVVPVANKALMLQGQSGRSLAPVPFAAPNTRITGEIGRDASAASWKEKDTISDTDPPHEHEERWDGRVWTEEELQEFLDMKNASVVQIGKDFFDGEGNFLYRI